MRLTASAALHAVLPLFAAAQAPADPQKAAQVARLKAQIELGEKQIAAAQKQLADLKAQLERLEGKPAPPAPEAKPPEAKAEAPPKPKTIAPGTFEVGQVGPFEEQRDGEFSFVVDEVLSGTQAVVHSVVRDRALDPRTGRPTGPFRERHGNPFIVSGVDASNWADDKRVILPGVYRVGKPKNRDGRTLYVVERQPEPPPGDE